MTKKPGRTPPRYEPTPEEIWGTPEKMGLAEQERLARKERNNDGPQPPSSKLYMLPYGHGKLKGEG